VDETFYRQLADMLSRGPLVVATVIRTQGSVPRQAGAKLAVGSDGTLLGTVGGGAAEAEVIARAQTLLQTAVPVGDGDGESSPAGMPVSLDLNSPPLGVCGGRMHIWLQRWQGSLAQTLVAQILQALTQGQRAWLITPLHPQGFPYLSLGDSGAEHFASLPSRPQLLAGSWVEPLLPSPTLLIVGAGHCGLSLAQIAHLAGFRIWVQDDRPDWVTPQRFPVAERLCSEPFAQLIPHLHRIPQLYIALVTRSYSLDCQILRAIYHSGLTPHYLGMIGSRKRVQTVLRTLAQEGIPETAFSRLFAPIGLEIHAETPAEIAISITAQLIQVRRGSPKTMPTQRAKLKA
jgi:xanthine dehydrogenase accessory factor